jgi:acetyl-CoA carboxylase carboxyl transferase subunit beta
VANVEKSSVADDKENTDEKVLDERPAGDETATEAGARAESVESLPEEKPERAGAGDPKTANKSGKAKPAKKKESKPEKAGASGETPPVRREGRLSRLRFSKKKDMPGGLWLKCESCAGVIFRKELEEKNRVCPACGFHFTVPGRERIQMILDEGTWDERFAELESLDRLKFEDTGPYCDKLERAVSRTGQKDALFSGTGAILDRPIVLAVLDFGFLGGSMGEVVGEKIALSCELAIREKRPLVIFTSSGGARMHEGVLSLMQMAKTCAAVQGLRENGGFSVCVMTHPTTGGVTASFASVTDLVLAEPGALIGFAGPRVIATTLKQELPAGFQRAEFLLEKGMLDMIVPRSELRETLARLFDYRKGPRLAEGESVLSTKKRPSTEG